MVGGVVEGGGPDAADFGYEREGRAGREDVGEGSAQEGLGRAVVGGGVEGGYAEVDGALDDRGGGHGVRVGDVLAVEGCCAED